MTYKIDRDCNSWLKDDQERKLVDKGGEDAEHELRGSARLVEHQRNQHENGSRRSFLDNLSGLSNFADLISKSMSFSNSPPETNIALTLRS